MQEDPLQIVEALEVSGRGLVIVTNRRHSSVGVRMSVGQKVVFHTPAGQELVAAVQGLELFSSPFNPNRPFAFVVSTGVSKDQLPSGTIITLHSEER